MKMKIGLLFIIGIFGTILLQHGCGNANKANQSSVNNQNLAVALASPTPSPTATAFSNQSTVSNGAPFDEVARKSVEAIEEARREGKERCKNKPIGQIEATPPFSDRKTGIAPYIIKLDGSKSRDPNGKKIVKWEWRFGDGQTGEGKVVTHTYNKAGLFSIWLIVTNSDGETNLECSGGDEYVLVVEQNQ